MRGQEGRECLWFHSVLPIILPMPREEHSLLKEGLEVRARTMMRCSTIWIVGARSGFHREVMAVHGGGCCRVGPGSSNWGGWGISGRPSPRGLLPVRAGFAVRGDEEKELA
jgi:hypothetical protein